MRSLHAYNSTRFYQIIHRLITCSRGIITLKKRIYNPYLSPWLRLLTEQLVGRASSDMALAYFSVHCLYLAGMVSTNVQARIRHGISNQARCFWVIHFVGYVLCRCTTPICMQMVHKITKYKNNDRFLSFHQLQKNISHYKTDPADSKSLR